MTDEHVSKTVLIRDHALTPNPGVKLTFLDCMEPLNPSVLLNEHFLQQVSYVGIRQAQVYSGQMGLKESYLV